MGLLNTLRFVVDHPLNKGQTLSSLVRFGSWQVRSRVTASPIPVNFAGGTRLLVTRGQTGATGNIYTGLHEFREMAFVLHALRPEDLFVDVGANVGSYTVLAAGAVGARCISFEPDPSTMEALTRNVVANALTERVELRQEAVGREPGTVSFTSGQDTLNHVASSGDSTAVSVRITTLDNVLAGRSASLLKIDVEGYEHEVLAGASDTLADSKLIAVIVETNGSGSRYGRSDDDVHAQLFARSFVPCSYDPMRRQIEPLPAPSHDGNTIYIRDVARVRSLVESAPKFDIAGRRRI